MKVLLVGAGAVGQTYARHLQIGGAQISFFVKERYVQAARRGWTVYPLNRRKKTEPLTLYGYDTYSSTEEVAQKQWDQVWLCMSSTALRSGWIDDFLPSIGDAAVVMLQPGLKDREYILERFPEERLVSGLIGVIAYQAPLKGESFERVGTAYWLPPLAASTFSGPRSVVDPIIATMRRGRCPAMRVKNVPLQVSLASAMFMPLISALEGANWSFDSLKRSPLLKTGVSAAQEALIIAAAHWGRRPPFRRHLLSRFLVKMVMGVGLRLAPFPLETYLQVHFSKVGDQTRSMMQMYRDEGRSRGLSTTALDTLTEQVFTP
jgi:2-dehydropantoate 2-reductase